MPKKIMVVDDDPSIVEYLTELFQDTGYAVCSASDGSQALEVARAERPDLITLDIEMPDEWGPRFHRELTRDDELKKTPVIVISGLSECRFAVPKAVACFTKPFDRDAVLKAVKDVIG